jgi:large subunit ribosomal protein L10
MRAEKQLLLDEIKEKIEESKGFVALNYQNFTAARAREFRDKMAEIGGEFEVVRKRVFIKAAESVGIQVDAKSLSGHVGIVFAREEATQIAKGTVKFGEDNDKAVSVLGGHIDGVLCTAEDVEAIAKLPGIQEMRAQILAVLEAPMAQTVQTFHAVLASVLYCAEERSKKEEAQK